MILNFGHTLGHAVEKLKLFTMPHGHCVAAGFLAAAKMSEKRGFLTLEEISKLEAMMAGFGLPMTVDGLKEEDVLDAVKHDKKMEAGQIKFILLKEIGNASIFKDVSREEMQEGLHYILEENGVCQ